MKNELYSALESKPTLIDVIDTDEIGLRELTIELTMQAKLLGLDLQYVLNQVRQGFFGVEVQSLQRGDEEVKVWVRYSREERSHISNLERTRITTPNGGEYFLSDIASIQEVEGVVVINRRDGLREISVEADVASLDIPVPAVLGDIQQNILPELRERYPFVEYTFEGQSRASEKTAASAQRAGPVILILIIFLILLNSRSFSQLFITLILIPFSIIGVAWGHFIQGIPLSIFSMLGIIALIGILVNNILVFLTTFNDFLRVGKSFAASVYLAALSRFKPIMLTAITTAAGLTPLLLGASIGAQFLQPTAVAVFYGLLFATFLTLGLLPAMLVASNHLKRMVLGVIRSDKPSKEEIEPAIIEQKQLERLKSM